MYVQRREANFCLRPEAVIWFSTVNLIDFCQPAISTFQCEFDWFLSATFQCEFDWFLSASNFNVPVWIWLISISQQFQVWIWFWFLSAISSVNLILIPISNFKCEFDSDSYPQFQVRIWFWFLSAISSANLILIPISNFDFSSVNLILIPISNFDVSSVNLIDFYPKFQRIWGIQGFFFSLSVRCCWAVQSVECCLLRKDRIGVLAGRVQGACLFIVSEMMLGFTEWNSSCCEKAE